jgi:hypothetical protein
VAVISGTPSAIIGSVRYGQFPDAPGDELLAHFQGRAETIAALEKKADVSAVLVPVGATPAGQPVLWQTEALNDRDKASGITLAVLSIVLGLLTLGGHIHYRHPLSIGSEFIVDTIRGIPMLVIVLYVGLPLAGALKDATQGVFDPPNLMRGIAAAGAGLFGLSGGNLPLRHQRHSARPDRGGAQRGHERLADRQAHCPAAGLPHHYSATRQRVDRHSQGHIASIDPVHPRHHAAHAGVPVGELPAFRALQFSRHLLHSPDAGRRQPGEHDREKI